MKQVVLQFTAWELQVIMQLVVVEVRGVESPGVGATTLGVVVCAKAAPHAAVAATARMIAKALMTASPIAVSYHSNLPSVLEFVRFPAGTCRRADQWPSASHSPSGLLCPHPAASSRARRRVGSSKWKSSALRNGTPSGRRAFTEGLAPLQSLQRCGGNGPREEGCTCTSCCG